MISGNYAFRGAYNIAMDIQESSLSPLTVDFKFRNFFLNIKTNQLKALAKVVGFPGPIQVILGNLLMRISTNHSLFRCKTLPAHFNIHFLLGSLVEHVKGKIRGSYAFR